MPHNNKPNRQYREILNQVHEGMTVYDRDRDSIGTVEAIYFGAVDGQDVAEGATPATTSRAAYPRDDDLVEAAVEVFDPRDKVPTELAERLRYHGYIKIDSGWFGPDRYVMPDQIESVSDEGVFLNAKPSRLVKE